jgi:chromate transport protein ChrA
MLVTNQVIQRNIITNQTTLATSNNTLRSLFFIFLVGFRTKYVHNLVVLVTAFMGFSGYRAFSTAFPRPAMLGLAAAYFRRSQALPMLAGSATNNGTRKCADRKTSKITWVGRQRAVQRRWRGSTRRIIAVSGDLLTVPR